MSAPVVAEKATAKIVSTKNVSKARGVKTVRTRTITKAPNSSTTVSTSSRGKTVPAKISGAKSSWMPRLRPAKSTVRYRQLLAMELLIGLIVILTGVSPSAEKKDFAAKAEQAAALLVVFFILSAMTTAGPSSARVSASLGGVILLVLVVKTQAARVGFDPSSVIPGHGQLPDNPLGPGADVPGGIPWGPGQLQTDPIPRNEI